MLIRWQSHRSVCVQARPLEQDPRPDRPYPRYLAGHHLYPDNPVLEYILRLFSLPQAIPRQR